MHRNFRFVSTLLALVLLLGFAASAMAMEGDDLTTAKQLTEKSFEAIVKFDYPAAEKYALEALKAKPGYEIAKLNLGVAYYYQGKKDEAKQVFVELAAKDSKTIPGKVSITGADGMTVDEIAERNILAVEGKCPLIGCFPAK